MFKGCLLLPRYGGHEKLPRDSQIAACWRPLKLSGGSVLCSEEDLCKVQGTDGMLTTDLHYAQRRPLGDPQSRAAHIIR